MTAEQYQEKYSVYVSMTEQRLTELCDLYLPKTSTIAQAARYSLLSGGKRVRAVLTLAACELCGSAAKNSVDYACALEMLHCYSLIHDDMPCMDNDNFRRGRPSCHIQFGEANALLAADALVTAAFEVIANTAQPPLHNAHAVMHLAGAGGARGMLLGQELDKKYETETATEAQLLELHKNKTGALIVAAVQLGCDAADANEITRSALVKYADELGLVFQIVDDVLDVTSTSEQLGKPTGSDEINDKTTFVTLYGCEGASVLAHRHTETALQAISSLGERSAFLSAMAQALEGRNK